MNRIIAPLLAALLFISASAELMAQEPLPVSSEAEMEFPGELTLPSESATEFSSGEPVEESFPDPAGTEWDGDGILQESGIEQMFCRNPIAVESTGTWLRRGFWYLEVDAVILNRKSSRDKRVLIGQLVGVDGFNRPLDNEMVIEPRRPGAEGVPRMTLGHFLFRDAKNRDHVTEFTIYGGGQWTQESSIEANPDNILGSVSLLVPFSLDNGNASFDTATASSFRYDSRFNSFELNYLVKDRLGRDRMELEPNGQWVRRAGPTMSRTFLAGLRFFDLTEDLAWQASGIDPDGDDSTVDAEDDDFGDVDVRADNDNFGTQLGFSCSYETARWSLGAEAKGGMFLNLIDVDSRYFLTRNASDEDILTESTLETDEIAFIGEASFQGKWHLRPNFSLRASLEIMMATSQAFASSQFPEVFIPGGLSIIDTGNESTYLGGSIGFEGYW